MEAQGELITTQYFDSLAAEIDDLLQVRRSLTSTHRAGGSNSSKREAQQQQQRCGRGAVQHFLQDNGPLGCRTMQHTVCYASCSSPGQTSEAERCCTHALFC